MKRLCVHLDVETCERAVAWGKVHGISGLSAVIRYALVKLLEGKR